MKYSDFLYHLYKAYEQFNMTEDTKYDAYMCIVLDGSRSHEEGVVNRFFFNATGVEMSDLHECTERLQDEIKIMQDKYYTTWARAIREELFGTDKNLEGDKDKGRSEFCPRYSNQLRQEWIYGQYRKAITT